MPNIIEISDIAAPELDVYARLTGAQLKNRRDQEKGVFIAESTKVIQHALQAGCTPLSMLMERKRIEGSAREIIESAGEIPVYTADRAILEQLTGFQLTRGVLCAMRRPRLPEVEEICAHARRIAVLDGIVDPTNVGAIFRSAVALGVDAVLVTPGCCDPLHRRAVRVSMGAVFQAPWTILGNRSADWPHPGMERLRGMGFKLAALALSDRSVRIDDERLMGEARLALLLGTEGNGLPEETVAACDYTVRIPMSHGVDSLNVAAASAVAFWQLGRR